MTPIRKIIFSIIIVATTLSVSEACAFTDDMEMRVLLKRPGNPSVEYVLAANGDRFDIGMEHSPLAVVRDVEDKGDKIVLKMTVSAVETIYYNMSQHLSTNFQSDECIFYMPGFWYRKNLRSPESAPSFRSSDTWLVREDRLSTPLTGVYNEKTGEWCTVMRIDEFQTDALAAHKNGDVILDGDSSVGFTGFSNSDSNAKIVFGFPYREAPRTYLRKLSLAPSVTAYEKLEAGETRTIVWEIRKGRSMSWSDFVAAVWDTSYDRLKPLPVDVEYTQESAKKVLSRYFEQSFVDKYPLKYYSGVELRTADCKSNGIAELGFVGRVLLNAFNALEYGRETSENEMIENAEAVFHSYLSDGFTPGGLFREKVDFVSGEETLIYSIRRQSEAVYAILNYLKYEKSCGRSHPEYERRIRLVLDRLSLLQNADGSFPRKFNDGLVVSDASGGSTSSAVLPFAMAFSYFGDKKFLETARKASSYIESSIIAPADYFSSTLDANCEDKEASLYASTAMYYMYLVEKKDKAKEHYAQLCLKSAYFALSWYYLWDVPFARGQMLGDVGFKSRGWGNVSVENNHIDVFIYEFADVLDFLAEKFHKPCFSEFTSVIRTSMLQLMPVNGNRYDIASDGYYPEVVQHTNWDYGKNGKGFYNDIFAPGWTVASLWQMLSPSRAERFFNK